MHCVGKALCRDMTNLVKISETGQHLAKAQSNVGVASRECIMSDGGFLHRYFLNNGGKKLHKWLHYFDIYEHHFSRLRERPIKMLEIGVFGGGSLQMWREYFHPESQIVGIDINPDCADAAGERIAVHIGSQADPEFLSEIRDMYGSFDIILDDGSHKSSHVITSFDNLYDAVVPDGTYMVEDMHCSYWPQFEGGLRKEGTFIKFAKLKIDELNSPHIDGMRNTRFTRSPTGISFYDSIVVFEKRPQGRRHTFITRNMRR